MHKFFSLLLLCFLCIPTLSQASDAEKGLPLIFYKIKRGDTLIKLSRKYLKQSTDLEFIRSLNHLRNINLLPEGEVLKIPRSAVKQSPSQATVIALNCAQSIRAGVPPKQIQIGSILREGAIIDIPAECHSAMQLEDGSTLRLSHNPDKKPSDLFKELPKFLRQVAPHEKCAECLPKGLAANAGIARP